jgi:hypothetical protein
LWDTSSGMGGRLLRAALVEGAARIFKDGPEVWKRTAYAVKNWIHDPREIDIVAVERPPARGDDMPSRTLIVQDLLAVGTWILALFPNARHIAYFPHEWEGTVSRKGEVDPVIQRIKGRLEPEELERVILPCESKAHNVWDSVGIGLKALGRFERKQVFSRGLKAHREAP